MRPIRRSTALVDRYVAAAAPRGSRVVGRLSAPADARADDDREISARRSHRRRAARRDARRQGAQIAFINSGGVRTDLIPGADGSVTYGQIFALQPFGNNLVVKTLTGAQIKALLEQQFDSGTNTVAQPNMLLPSKGFAFAYDLSRPAGQRIVAMTLNGKPIDPAANYRVAVNNFLATGGDNFTVLTDGTDAVDAGTRCRCARSLPQERCDRS